MGDREQDIERLVGALSEIRRRFKRDKKELLPYQEIVPQVILSPQQAFYADKEKTVLAASTGRISGEMVMCYPPGIPIVAPGERITSDIVSYIEYAKFKGCSLMGTEDPTVDSILTISENEGRCH